MFSLHVDTARTWRGGQNQVLLTVLGLRARGHRTALVAHPKGELLRRVSETEDIFALTPRTEIDLKAGWKLSRIIRELKPDIVHAHDGHAITFVALALFLSGLRPNLRFVASRRVDFHVGKNIFSRWKYRQVDRFICASAFISSMLTHDGIAARKTTVVYEGIDQNQITASPSLDIHKIFGFPKDSLLVGNVAALVPHKGQRYLVEAARLVVDKLPQTRFLIAGEGELESSLRKQIATLDLTQHVILTGFRPDVLSLHKSFDLFVMSSVTEGLGTSALDAMFAKRPVVATRAGGLSEVVDDGETGLLVPVRDASALATGIRTLLENKAWRDQCGRLAEKQAHRRFTASRMVDETVKVYADLVDKFPEAGKAGHVVSG